MGGRTLTYAGWVQRFIDYLLAGIEENVEKPIIFLNRGKNSQSGRDDGGARGAM